MGYIEDSLQPGEILVHKTKKHWIILVWPILVSLLTLRLVFPLIITIPWLILAALDYHFSEFGVTNKRIIIKVGILRKTTYETVINKIEAIDVHQGIIARIFGYGTVKISGTGGTVRTFPNVATPYVLRQKVQEQIAA